MIHRVDMSLNPNAIKKKKSRKSFRQMITNLSPSPLHGLSGLGPNKERPTCVFSCTCIQLRCLKILVFFLIIGNGGIMHHIYIYPSILKVMGTYELNKKYDHETTSILEKYLHKI